MLQNVRVTAFAAFFKVLEYDLNPIIQEQVSTDNMQFGFMTGRITTNVIFILKQLQQKSLHEKKNTHFAFFDLGKVVHCVSCTVLWWTMWKLGIDEWIIQIVTSMHENGYSKVTIINGYNKPINASLSVHQGSMLSTLLFIIVIKSLLHEFRIGCPWEL